MAFRDKNRHDVFSGMGVVLMGGGIGRTKWLAIVMHAYIHKWGSSRDMFFVCASGVHSMCAVCRIRDIQN